MQNIESLSIRASKKYMFNSSQRKYSFRITEGKEIVLTHTAV